ncbi:uncharacterized protein LOC127265601 [Andrographis paniculata]|uniref:uncharacterized protein LOC127265601 n=1 Tax=Andrographis paniculata TaxID=175694 RepID=UPI0021E7DF12|nr:uncharacterized protein LOC127265601 [Andrographis paniculata]
MSATCGFRGGPVVFNPLKFGKKAASMAPKRISVRASKLDSSFESPNLVERMERAWLISEQPMPVGCASCDSKGHVDCKWCSGTGFFILGETMLCQVPSRSTACVICAGKGCGCCPDCKGSGYRAKWLGQPPVAKK